MLSIHPTFRISTKPYRNDGTSSGVTRGSLLTLYCGEQDFTVMYCTVLWYCGTVVLWYCGTVVLFSWKMFNLSYIIGMVPVTASLSCQTNKQELYCHYFNYHCTPGCPAEYPPADPVPEKLYNLTISCAGFFDKFFLSLPKTQASSSSVGIISACNVHRFQRGKSSSYWIVLSRAAGDEV